jgi:hypothetical protein
VNGPGGGLTGLENRLSENKALRSHINHAPVDRHSVTAHRRMPPGGGPSFCRDWARGYTQRRMQGCRILLILFVSLAVQAQPAGTGIDGGGKVIEEYLVLGTVLWTNVATATIAIRGTTLIGRLHLRVKSYRVRQAGALIGLRPGDRITATFSEKDRMLHHLRRILPGKLL